MKLFIFTKLLLTKKKNFDQGLTLLQLLIIIFVAIAISVFVLPSLLQTQNEQRIQKIAQENLQTFAKSAGIEPLECENQDVDKNGFVNCQAKNIKSQIITLECSYEKKNQDCKIIPATLEK